MAQYRVDELAHLADTSVRNVRVYQERGLLPPPQRVGRTGVYTDAHLARLRLIRVLLQRGYTFATIAELLDAWTAGQGIAELLGLEDVLAAPWSDEPPLHLTQAELSALLGPISVEDLGFAVRYGLIEVDAEGNRFRLPSPKLVRAGAELVASGVPLPAVLHLAAQLSEGLDRIAELVFRLIDNHLAGPDRSSQDVAEAVARLRPLAREAVDALLVMALTRQSEQLVARRAHRSRRVTESGGASPEPASAVTTSQATST